MIFNACKDWLAPLSLYPFEKLTKVVVKQSFFFSFIFILDPLFFRDFFLFYVEI